MSARNAMKKRGANFEHGEQKILHPSRSVKRLNERNSGGCGKFF